MNSYGLLLYEHRGSFYIIILHLVLFEDVLGGQEKNLWIIVREPLIFNREKLYTLWYLMINTSTERLVIIVSDLASAASFILKQLYCHMCYKKGPRKTLQPASHWLIWHSIRPAVAPIIFLPVTWNPHSSHICSLLPSYILVYLHLS